MSMQNVKAGKVIQGFEKEFKQELGIYPIPV